MWNLETVSEFEVQAAILHKLKAAGYKVRGEVSFRHPSTGRMVRVDLLVLKDGQPALILEIKSASGYALMSKAERRRARDKYINVCSVECLVLGPDDVEIVDRIVQASLRLV